MKPTRILTATIFLALAAALTACGSGDSTTADQLAPTSGDGGSAVRTKVPVYAGDPDATAKPSPGDLSELPALQRREQTADVPAIRGSDGQDVAQWVSTVNNDVATFWQTLFNQQGLEYVAADQVLYGGEPTETACGEISEDNGPLYCTGDQTIYLPVTFFELVFGGVSDLSDASIAMAIAHESAHHTQNLLGIFDRPSRTIDTELQADCLSGVWASSVLARGALEDDDLAETLGFVRILGDPDTTRADDPGAHGNGQQRVAAYQEGFDSGSPAGCEGIGERLAPPGGKIG